MVAPGPALGGDQVIATVAPEQAWPLDPRPAHRTVPKYMLGADELQELQVELTQPDLAGSGGNGVLAITGPCAPATPVDIEEEGRVNPSRVELDRRRPRSGRVRGRAQVGLRPSSAPRDRENDVEDTVVIAHRRRPHPVGQVEAVQVDLSLTGEHVADLHPVHQVLAHVHRQARPVAERRGDEHETVPDAADRRVGVAAGQDRVWSLRQRSFSHRAGTGGRLDTWKRFHHHRGIV